MDMHAWITLIGSFGMGLFSLPLLAETGGQTATLVPPAMQQVTPSAENSQNEMTAWMIESAQVAKDYVEGLDRGEYASSWPKGDILFRRTISQKEWTTALELARKRLGGVKSRTLKDQRPAWDPHGLPKGPYMVVEYNTSFDKAPNSGELLTLRRGDDGRWRVLTYQVN